LNEVIKREGLSDAQKYKILSDYSKGVPVRDIAKEVNRDRRFISNMIQQTLKEMNTIRETNDLIVGTDDTKMTVQQGINPTKFLTSDFLSQIESQGEAYAYYVGKTNDNTFALAQSGLDKGIAPNLKKQTKDYVLRIRGQFLREIPEIKAIIKAEYDKRLKECNIEKPHIQVELLAQIDELKEICTDDPKQRVNLLKAIEMLGRTIGAFTDRIETVETDARSGLEILMEKIKQEEGVSAYEQKE